MGAHWGGGGKTEAFAPPPGKNNIIYICLLKQPKTFMWITFCKIFLFRPPSLEFYLRRPCPNTIKKKNELNHHAQINTVFKGAITVFYIFNY